MLTPSNKLRTGIVALGLRAAWLWACVVWMGGMFSASATLVHRWSFNEPSGAVAAGTVLVDSVGGSEAVVRGVGATRNGSALTLPGTTSGNVGQSTISAYVDLPNGLVSSKTDLTFELWAAPLSHKSWQRLIDCGNMNIAGIGGGAPGEVTGDGTTAPGGTESSDDILLALSRGGSLNEQRLEGRINGGGTLITDSALSTSAGTRYHYVLVFEDQAGSFGANGGQLRWYRNGAFVASVDLGFRLASLNDVNNWIGRSQWSGDMNAHVALHELRVHDAALTPAEIQASFTAGPDATIAPPTAAADRFSIHRGQHGLFPVLNNDTGSVNAASVEIVQAPQFGTASADGQGRIHYAHGGGAATSDAFTYRVSGVGGTSEPATVTVDVAGFLRLTNNVLNVPSAPPATTIALQTAFSGLSQPVALATPPGETNRLFVCEKGGLLRVFTNIFAANPSAGTFLNLPALLTSRGESIRTQSEQGLLGLAFHPGYATNRFFFVFYSVTKSGVVYNRVSRFTTQAANPNAADTASELILLEQRDDADNHNGGDLHFGPDGYLYIATGDEGGGDDQYNNSQKINADFFSAILRIDVDKRPGSLEPNTHAAVIRDGGVARYAVPSDNPFVGATSFNGATVNPTTVRTEFWAVGMRNPWRMSFDPVTGWLWVGDVGQGAREEIDIVTSGGNYGWAFREGTLNGPKSGSAPANFNTVHKTPIYSYARGSGTFQGNSVTGGLVARNNRFPAFEGLYFFADYGSGNIWTLRTNAVGAPTVQRIAGEGGIVAFGRDPSNNDVLLADIDGGRILRLVVTTAVGSYPQTLAETGLFADPQALAPSQGVLPYAVNLPFWSDHALKRRWFVVPDATNTMVWSRDGLWTYPAGTVWVKHFDLELERGNPATRKRLETRLLVKNQAGAYGVSYRWNDAGTEATLVADEGVNFNLSVTNHGAVQTQNWRIPSRAECMVCHTPQAGFSLSFNTRQLNRTNDIHGFAGNQLELLRSAGYLANEPDPSETLPRHHAPGDESVSLEARARSYLAVNCAYCHKAGGSAPTAWDGRPELALGDTGLLYGPAANNGGDPANLLVVPGDLLHSVLYNRVGATNGFTRMPPLATSELDAANLALLAQWITNALPARQTFAQWQTNVFQPGDTQTGADEDHDLDRRTNREEFLTGTDPRSDTSLFRPEFALAEGAVSFQFELPTNRSFQIEVSTNLTDWNVWIAPGNDGAPVPGGERTISGEAAGDQQYFRVRLWEN